MCPVGAVVLQRRDGSCACADGPISPSAVSPDCWYPMGLVVIGLIFAATLRDFSGGELGGGRVGLRGGGEGDLARSVDSP